MHDRIPLKTHARASFRLMMRFCDEQVRSALSAAKGRSELSFSFYAQEKRVNIRPFLQYKERIERKRENEDSKRATKRARSKKRNFAISAMSFILAEFEIRWA